MACKPKKECAPKKVCAPKKEAAPAPAPRKGFITEDEIIAEVKIKDARAEYPDDKKAMTSVKRFTKANIDHTFKWVVNGLFLKNANLARVAVEPENLEVWKQYYKAQKKAAQGQ